MGYVQSQVLSANGVSKVTAEVGQKLDPNLHEAMFDGPNPAAEPGIIAVIVKVCHHAQDLSLVCTCPQQLMSYTVAHLPQLSRVPLVWLQGTDLLLLVCSVDTR